MGFAMMFVAKKVACNLSQKYNFFFTRKMDYGTIRNI